MTARSGHPPDRRVPPGEPAVQRQFPGRFEPGWFSFRPLCGSMVGMQPDLCE
ncbi:hypothetical protein BD833_10268 [Blastococcus xanthinilyticus]|uniref:Uncharacterized protein n=1 Tax=Blastococcus xanthinilyticus TaxID=1564164 RepID=A0A5S5D1E8_9ACTN|nr:hypothetical protein BD833_10268 [Blastococcus xanthinilyticus]